MTDHWTGGLALIATDKQTTLFISCDPMPDQRRVLWGIFIEWDRYITNEGPVTVWSRFGVEPAFQASWGLAAEGRMTFAPVELVTGEQGFMTRLQRTDRFVARVTRHNGTTLTAEWAVQGLTPPLRLLVAACNQAAGT